MERIKKYLKLREDANSLGSKMSYFKNEIARIEEELQPLENEALKLEIIGDPVGFEKKSKEFEAKKADLKRLKESQEDSIKRLKIMQELIPSYREEAFAEIKEAFRKPFQKALKEFSLKLKVTLEAEKMMEKIRLEAVGEAHKIDVSWSSIPEWDPILMRKRGYSDMPREWEDFFKKMKDNGFDVEV